MTTSKDILGFGNSFWCGELAYLNAGVFSFCEGSVSEKKY